MILMGETEATPLGMAVFVLVWAMMNCLWLALVRRPSVAALISLELLVALTLLSRFKYDKLWMTIDFVDVLIVDQDTSAFLLATFSVALTPIVLGHVEARRSQPQPDDRAVCVPLLG